MNAQPRPDSPQARLQRARSDLALARAAVTTPDVLFEDACFHAQQCAEKSIKGLLVHRSIQFPRTHAVETLLDLFEEKTGSKIPTDVDDAFELTQYAAQTRYPGDWEPITEDEAQTAIRMGEQVLTWAQGQIGDRGAT